MDVEPTLLDYHFNVGDPIRFRSWCSAARTAFFERAIFALAACSVQRKFRNRDSNIQFDVILEEIHLAATAFAVRCNFYGGREWLRDIDDAVALLIARYIVVGNAVFTAAMRSSKMPVKDIKPYHGSREKHKTNSVAWADKRSVMTPKEFVARSTVCGQRATIVFPPGLGPESREWVAIDALNAEMQRRCSDTAVSMVFFDPETAWPAFLMAETDLVVIMSESGPEKVKRTHDKLRRIVDNTPFRGDLKSGVPKQWIKCFSGDRKCVEKLGIIGPVEEKTDLPSSEYRGAVLWAMRRMEAQRVHLPAVYVFGTSLRSGMLDVKWRYKSGSEIDKAFTSDTISFPLQYDWVNEARAGWGMQRIGTSDDRAVVHWRNISTSATAVFKKMRHSFTVIGSGIRETDSVTTVARFFVFTVFSPLRTVSPDVTEVAMEAMLSRMRLEKTHSVANALFELYVSNGRPFAYRTDVESAGFVRSFSDKDIRAGLRMLELAWMGSYKYVLPKGAKRIPVIGEDSQSASFNNADAARPVVRRDVKKACKQTCARVGDAFGQETSRQQLMLLMSIACNELHGVVFSPRVVADGHHPLGKSILKMSARYTRDRQRGMAQGDFIGALSMLLVVVSRHTYRGHHEFTSGAYDSAILQAVGGKKRKGAQGKKYASVNDDDDDDDDDDTYQIPADASRKRKRDREFSLSPVGEALTEVKERAIEFLTDKSVVDVDKWVSEFADAIEKRLNGLDKSTSTTDVETAIVETLDGMFAANDDIEIKKKKEETKFFPFKILSDKEFEDAAGAGIVQAVAAKTFVDGVKAEIGQYQANEPLLLDRIIEIVDMNTMQFTTVDEFNYWDTAAVALIYTTRQPTTLKENLSDLRDEISNGITDKRKEMRAIYKPLYIKAIKASGAVVDQKAMNSALAAYSMDIFRMQSRKMRLISHLMGLLSATDFVRLTRNASVTGNYVIGMASNARFIGLNDAETQRMEVAEGVTAMQKLLAEYFDETDNVLWDDDLDRLAKGLVAILVGLPLATREAALSLQDEFVGLEAEALTDTLKAMRVDRKVLLQLADARILEGRMTGEKPNAPDVIMKNVFSAEPVQNSGIQAVEDAASGDVTQGEQNNETDTPPIITITITDEAKEEPQSPSQQNSEAVALLAETPALTTVAATNEVEEKLEYPTEYVIELFRLINSKPKAAFRRSRFCALVRLFPTVEMSMNEHFYIVDSDGDIDENPEKADVRAAILEKVENTLRDEYHNQDKFEEALAIAVTDVTESMAWRKYKDAFKELGKSEEKIVDKALKSARQGVKNSFMDLSDDEGTDYDDDDDEKEKKRKAAKEEKKRLEEEKRLAEEEKKRFESLTDEQKKAEEDQRLEEEKQRLEEEKRLAEEEKKRFESLTDEQKKAEEDQRLEEEKQRLEEEKRRLAEEEEKRLDRRALMINPDELFDDDEQPHIPRGSDFVRTAVIYFLGRKHVKVIDYAIFVEYKAVAKKEYNRMTEAMKKAEADGDGDIKITEEDASDGDIKITEEDASDVDEVFMDNVLGKLETHWKSNSKGVRLDESGMRERRLAKISKRATKYYDQRFPDGLSGSPKWEYFRDPEQGNDAKLQEALNAFQAEKIRELAGSLLSGFSKKGPGSSYKRKFENRNQWIARMNKAIHSAVTILVFLTKLWTRLRDANQSLLEKIEVFEAYDHSPVPDNNFMYDGKLRRRGSTTRIIATTRDIETGGSKKYAAAKLNEEALAELFSVFSNNFDAVFVLLKKAILAKIRKTKTSFVYFQKQRQIAEKITLELSGVTGITDADTMQRILKESAHEVVLDDSTEVGDHIDHSLSAMIEYFVGNANNAYETEILYLHTIQANHDSLGLQIMLNKREIERQKAGKRAIRDRTSKKGINAEKAKRHLSEYNLRIARLNSERSTLEFARSNTTAYSEVQTQIGRQSAFAASIDRWERRIDELNLKIPQAQSGSKIAELNRELEGALQSLKNAKISHELATTAINAAKGNFDVSLLMKNRATSMKNAARHPRVNELMKYFLLAHVYDMARRGSVIFLEDAAHANMIDSGLIGHRGAPDEWTSEDHDQLMYIVRYVHWYLTRANDDHIIDIGEEALKRAGFVCDGINVDLEHIRENKKVSTQPAALGKFISHVRAVLVSFERQSNDNLASIPEKRQKVEEEKKKLEDFVQKSRTDKVKRLKKTKFLPKLIALQKIFDYEVEKKEKAIDELREIAETKKNIKKKIKAADALEKARTRAASNMRRITDVHNRIPIRYLESLLADRVKDVRQKEEDVKEIDDKLEESAERVTRAAKELADAEKQAEETGDRELEEFTEHTAETVEFDQLTKKMETARKELGEARTLVRDTEEILARRKLEEKFTDYQEEQTLINALTIQLHGFDRSGVVEYSNLPAKRKNSLALFIFIETMKTIRYDTSFAPMDKWETPMRGTAQLARELVSVVDDDNINALMNVNGSVDDESDYDPEADKSADDYGSDDEFTDGSGSDPDENESASDDDESESGGSDSDELSDIEEDNGDGLEAIDSEPTNQRGDSTVINFPAIIDESEDSGDETNAEEDGGAVATVTTNENEGQGSEHGSDNDESSSEEEEDEEVVVPETATAINVDASVPTMDVDAVPETAVMMDVDAAPETVTMVAMTDVDDILDTAAMEDVDDEDDDFHFSFAQMK